MIAIDPRIRNGIAQQYNFQIQQSLPKDLVYKIAYVGNMGRRLETSYDFNQVEPGAAAPALRRPLRFVAPNVQGASYNVSDGLSSYHSLQMSLERRFANGIGFLTAYTWAHSIDDVANQFGGGDIASTLDLRPHVFIQRAGGDERTLILVVDDLSIDMAERTIDAQPGTLGRPGEPEADPLVALLASGAAAGGLGHGGGSLLCGGPERRRRRPGRTSDRPSDGRSPWSAYFLPPILPVLPALRRTTSPA